MRIQVTRENIKTGTPQSQSTCPIAHAANRAEALLLPADAAPVYCRIGRYGLAVMAQANNQMLYDGRWHNETISGWMEDFDRGNAVPPVSIWEDDDGSWHIGTDGQPIPTGVLQAGRGKAGATCAMPGHPAGTDAPRRTADRT